MEKIMQTPEELTKRIEDLVSIIKSNLKFEYFETIIEHIKLFKTDKYSKNNPRELNDWFDFLTESIKREHHLFEFSIQQLKLILEYCSNSNIGLISSSNKNYFLVEIANYISLEFEFLIYNGIEIYKNGKN